MKRIRAHLEQLGWGARDVPQVLFRAPRPVDLELLDDDVLAGSCTTTSMSLVKRGSPLRMVAIDPVTR